MSEYIYTDYGFCPDCGEPRGVCQCVERRVEDALAALDEIEGDPGDFDFDLYAEWVRQEAEYDLAIRRCGCHLGHCDLEDTAYCRMECPFSCEDEP